MSTNASYRPTFFTTYRAPRTTEDAQKLYNHIRTVAYALDSLSGAIPGLDRLPFDIGLEALVGAVLPIFGDLIGALAGLYIIYLCSLFKVGNMVLGHMILNVVIDGGVGIVPFVGDLLDVAWKANMRNLGLLEAHLIKQAKQGGFAVQVAPPYEAKARPPTGFDWTSIAAWLGTQARSRHQSGRFGGW